MQLRNSPAALETVPPAPGPNLEPRPGLGAVIRRVALSLAVACVIPAALFYSVFAVSGVFVAMGAALTWQYGALAFRAVTGRRTSGLLVIAAAVTTGRTLISIAAHSSFLYFLQPIVTDCLIGTSFLISLLGAKPIAARLAGDFYPITEEVANRPSVRTFFRLLTLSWGLLYLGKGSLTLWLLLSQSLEVFVLVKTISVVAINLSAVAGTITVGMLMARREGLVEPAVVRQNPIGIPA
jgi:hypothetical protein